MNERLDWLSGQWLPDCTNLPHMIEAASNHGWDMLIEGQLAVKDNSEAGDLSGNWKWCSKCLTTLSLTVFRQGNFMADFLQVKCNFTLKTAVLRFWTSIWGRGDNIQCAFVAWVLYFSYGALYVWLWMSSMFIVYSWRACHSRSLGDGSTKRLKRIAVTSRNQIYRSN